MKLTAPIRLTTLLLTSAITLGSAFAQNSMPGMDMSTPSASSSMPGMTMSTGSMDTTATLSKLSGKAFDRAFLSMMIPHHQAALDMARAILPTTKDAQVKRWAQGIISSQQAEITTMTALLKPLGGADPKMMAMMDGMKGMGTMVKAAKNPDLAFVQGMVPHHSSAIDMANVALQKSADPKVLKLAQNIVVAQAKEMYEFRTWLLKK
ncbi:DUF305 domain-containing protein [Deinococcus sp.]|uniref:DUF305 domain-containing protein n=1 Tax=Deinococcus sp. TaxID=47478 RepID=UPI0025CE7E52|nr:DUF305 domain-containing protein [Deinococcus sp.]